MTDFLAQFGTINLFKDLLVPSLAALGSAWWVSRKFKNEKLWQDKYVAYQRVLASVEAIRYWGEEVRAEGFLMPTIGWFDGKESNDFYAEAKREVAKQSVIGTILLSPDFVEQLTKFQTEMNIQTNDANESYQENDAQDEQIAFAHHGAEIRKIADKYIPILIKIARKDLMPK